MYKRQTLHWTRNDGEVHAGDLLLLDAGVECHNLYTADVTRTMPVSGKFSPAQRRIYELVLRAQKAGIAAVRPGVPFMEMCIRDSVETGDREFCEIHDAGFFNGCHHASFSWYHCTVDFKPCSNGTWG